MQFSSTVKPSLVHIPYITLSLGVQVATSDDDCGNRGTYRLNFLLNTQYNVPVSLLLKLPAFMALQANSVTGTIVAAFPGQ